MPSLILIIIAMTNHRTNTSNDTPQQLPPSEWRFKASQRAMVLAFLGFGSRERCLESGSSITPYAQDKLGKKFVIGRAGLALDTVEPLRCGYRDQEENAEFFAALPYSTTLLSSVNCIGGPYVDHVMGGDDILFSQTCGLSRASSIDPHIWVIHLCRHHYTGLAASFLEITRSANLTDHGTRTLAADEGSGFSKLNGPGVGNLFPLHYVGSSHQSPHLPRGDGKDAI
ncbi:hypothetical protein B0I35DRAFT_458969 [Stachybotrys elegans]|uniref:Uncharacterized protein n=1 Tax=Stachybotrys elegans TaxID=80388 RepID=A0A8K0T109_9HYPO|nr:hypothetical protein B0I35DRAFT_458969 [Stachybotrys elegans]